MTAFRGMLDQEYPNTLRREQGDHNNYVLGRLGGHYVVLACLPGEQGIGAAAVVGNNLSRTFTSIRSRLLVGIGGGIPSKRHDIRLGDVVVSMPDTKSAHGGVVQYDLVREDDGGIRRKGFLAQPPAHLRAAVGLMQSNHMVQDSNIGDFVEQMMSRKPKLRQHYERPGDETDTLFPDDVPHVPGMACENCDAS